MPSILCSISTRGRYFTTLPLAIQAVMNQTRKVDKFVIFDDNDDQQDLRENLVYKNLFHIMDAKGIAWEWIYARKQGQHYNHQLANKMGYDWVWRVDDDVIPDPNVLENLCSYIADDVGAIGGSILTPPLEYEMFESTGKIENLDSEINIQWKSSLDKVYEVDHLHCSFLYRAGVHDYNLNLSRMAHREETLFTYGLQQLGYKILVVPNTKTWHMRYPEGGIRSDDDPVPFANDEMIFRNLVSIKDQTPVVLDCGMGDHIVFKRVLKDIKNPVIYSCYPDIIPGKSIAEANAFFGNIDQFNIYAKMDEWNWTGSLEDAFRKMYVR